MITEEFGKALYGTILLSKHRIHNPHICKRPEVIDVERYLKNKETFSEKDQERLARSRVCVVGCGGLGGYVIEMLGRLGVGWITVIDGDQFDATNLNRQILSHTRNAGMSKAIGAKERMALVNPEVHIDPVNTFLNKDNGESLLKHHDVIVDALDNIDARLMLQDFAESLGIPMVFGGIGGWFGQVSTIFPGDRTLQKVYAQGSQRVEKKLGTPSFTPATVSSIQTSEVVKLLLNRGEILRKKILFVDLLEQSFLVFDL